MKSITLNMNARVGVICEGMMVEGVVVGAFINSNNTESYIIKCSDGKLPNDVYKYDTFVVPLRFIERR